MKKSNVHCMSCKEKKTMVKAELIKAKKGPWRLKGVCGTCGGKMSAFVKKEDYS